MTQLPNIRLFIKITMEGNSAFFLFLYKSGALSKMNKALQVDPFPRVTAGYEVSASAGEALTQPTGCLSCSVSSGADLLFWTGGLGAREEKAVRSAWGFQVPPTPCSPPPTWASPQVPQNIPKALEACCPGDWELGFCYSGNQLCSASALQLPGFWGEVACVAQAWRTWLPGKSREDPRKQSWRCPPFQGLGMCPQPRS